MNTSFIKNNKCTKFLFALLLVLTMVFSSSSINAQDQSVAKDYPHDFLLSDPAINIKVGEKIEINALDSPRIMEDDKNTNRDDLSLDITKGSDVIEIDYQNKQRKIFISGQKEGIALFDVSFPGYDGQKTTIAVNVTKDILEETNFDKLNKYNILYMFNDIYKYSVNLDNGSKVTHLDKEYQVTDGKVTLNLVEGHNPILVEKDGKSKIYNIRTKKIAYTIKNNTREGSNEFYEGDIAQVSFTGLVTPVSKLSRFYNPSDTHVVFDSSMPRQSKVTGSRSQWELHNSKLTVELTGKGQHKLTNGTIFENWFGAGLYSDIPNRPQSPGAGGTGNAPQLEGEFSVLPDIEFDVKENNDYKPEVYTPKLSNDGVFVAGDKVNISLEELNLQQIKDNHGKGLSQSRLLRKGFVAFKTDVPGHEIIKTKEVDFNNIDDMKNIEFQLPSDIKLGTYNITGGHLYAQYGETWWLKEKTYFDGKINDIKLKVVKPKIYTPELKNEGVIKGGDTVKISIESFDYSEIESKHLSINPGSFAKLRHANSVITTNIPGHEVINSKDVGVDNFNDLKTLEFTVGHNVPEGTYKVTGGHVFLAMGHVPQFMRDIYFFEDEINPINIEIKKSEEKIKAEKVEEVIKSLPTVDALLLSDEAKVVDARKVYDNNEELVKELVSKDCGDNLTLLENRIEAIKVEDVIKALPQINKLTKYDETKVNNARKVFVDSEEVVQSLVSNDIVDRLVASEKRIEVLKGILECNPVKKNGTTFYYKNIKNKCVLIKSVSSKKGTTATRLYNAKTKKMTYYNAVTKKGKRITARDYRTYTIKGQMLSRQVFGVNKKNKLIRTKHQVVKYNKKGYKYFDRQDYRSKTTNKLTKQTVRLNYANGKKRKTISISYRKGKKRSRTEYVYNKQGLKKSNKKYGKAYRYKTTFNKKGKALKTLRKQYNAKGKLSKNKSVSKRTGLK